MDIYIFIVAIYWTIAQQPYNFSSNKSVVNTSRPWNMSKRGIQLSFVFENRRKELERTVELQ